MEPAEAPKAEPVHQPAGLFVDLADGRVDERLASLAATTGQRVPSVGVLAQHDAIPHTHDAAHRGHQVDRRLGGGRVGAHPDGHRAAAPHDLVTGDRRIRRQQGCQLGGAGPESRVHGATSSASTTAEAAARGEAKNDSDRPRQLGHLKAPRVATRPLWSRPARPFDARSHHALDVKSRRKLSVPIGSFLVTQLAERVRPWLPPSVRPSSSAPFACSLAGLLALTSEGLRKSR